MPSTADDVQALKARVAELEGLLVAGPGAEGFARRREVINLPSIGVTLEVVESEDGKMRLGISAPRDVPIYRCERLPAHDQSAPPPPPYGGLPEIDLEAFVRHAREHPFVPTEAMRDEDWSDHAPKGAG
ncbi:MAG: carbon storage regulator [Gemmataceae bacterium]